MSQKFMLAADSVHLSSKIFESRRNKRVPLKQSPFRIIFDLKEEIFFSESWVMHLHQIRLQRSVESNVLITRT